jgi:Flp pilus assembly protein TadD
MRTRELVRKSDRLFDRGKYQPALALLEQALARRPNDPELHQSKGEVLAQMGRDAEAVQCYDRAIRLNPNDWWYHSWKGESLLTLRQPAKALAAYRRANILDPGNPVLLKRIALCNVLLGKKQAACRPLARLCNLDPRWRQNIARDPRLKALRSEPLFQQIIGSRGRAGNHDRRARSRKLRGSTSKTRWFPVTVRWPSR